MKLSFLLAAAPASVAATNLPVIETNYGPVKGEASPYRDGGGSGDVETYDGTGLASKVIIVVTINYRLGAFGFLAHPNLSLESGHNSSGNYGLLGQQFALRWVTVGGQSSGSASALDMMWSPLSSDLIAGVVSESGARGPHDPATGSSFGAGFLSTMNVSSIAELRRSPCRHPNIHEYVLPHGYCEALALNAHADVPVLTGDNKNKNDLSGAPSTASEYKSFWTEIFQNYNSDFLSVYPVTKDAEASTLSNQVALDIARVGTWEWAAEWAAGGAKSSVYTYFFTKVPAEDEAGGVYHGAELWYTFNNIPYSDYSNVTWNSTDYDVEATVSEYWANFIRGGDPNGAGLVYFPPFMANIKHTMWLGEESGAGPVAQSEARIAFPRKWMLELHEY
ncbi:Alpha/Beta hydrolase protein [Aspergillus filifer]